MISGYRRAVDNLDKHGWHNHQVQSVNKLLIDWLQLRHLSAEYYRGNHSDIWLISFVHQADRRYQLMFNFGVYSLKNEVIVLLSKSYFVIKNGTECKSIQMCLYSDYYRWRNTIELKLWLLHFSMNALQN